MVLNLDASDWLLVAPALMPLLLIDFVAIVVQRLLIGREGDADDGLAVRRAQCTLGAQDQKLLPTEFGGIPAHAGVLRHTKQIATRAGQKHFPGERQGSRRPCAASLEAVDLRRSRIEYIAAEIHLPDLIMPDRDEHGYFLRIQPGREADVVRKTT